MAVRQGVAAIRRALASVNGCRLWHRISRADDVAADGVNKVNDLLLYLSLLLCNLKNIPRLAEDRMYASP